MEIWKDIPGYEKIYQISNQGNVRSLERLIEIRPQNRGKYWIIVDGKVLAFKLVTHGYLGVSLSKKGKIRQTTVHRLVAEVFIPNPENKPEVNHKDGDKTNNNDWNLEWATREENEQHCWKIGLKTPVGEKSVNRVLGESVLQTYPSIAEASRKTGISSATISLSIAGKNNNKEWQIA